MKILIPDRWKIELSSDGGYYQEAFGTKRLMMFAKEQGTTVHEITETIKTIMSQLGFNVRFSEEKEEFIVNVLFKSGDIGNALNFLAGEFIGCSNIGSMTLNELVMHAAVGKGLKESLKNDTIEVRGLESKK